MAHDVEKEAAARASLRFVRDGAIVGLGSGSTATEVIRLLGERVRTGLKIRGIATSRKTSELATALGPPTSFVQVQEIDITLDGADEFDPQLSLIKGGGGALLHEKAVASASREVVIVTDSSKQVQVLRKFPLPIEVIAFAEPEARLLPTKAITSSTAASAGSPTRQHSPASSATCLESSEHGLFIGMANLVLIAKGNNVTELHRDNKQGRELDAFQHSL